MKSRNLLEIQRGIQTLFQKTNPFVIKYPTEGFEKVMKKITDKQDITSVKIDGNDCAIPKNLSLSTLGFFVMNSSGIISKEADKLSTQAQIDSLFNPEEITERTLISALIGAQNRSNQLYSAGVQAQSLPFKELYLKFALKYQNRVAQLAVALSKFKDRTQKIIVEKIRKRSSGHCRKRLKIACPTSVEQKRSSEYAKIHQCKTDAADCTEDLRPKTILIIKQDSTH